MKCMHQYSIGTFSGTAQLPGSQQLEFSLGDRHVWLPDNSKLHAQTSAFSALDKPTFLWSRGADKAV